MTTPERLQELASATEPRAGLTDLFFLSPGPGVTELLLVRHAQIEASSMEEDLHLTPLGREQAEVLAGYLARRRLDAVYASPTLRAQETAAPIAAAQGLSLETVEALGDIRTLKPMNRPFRELLAEEFGAGEVEAKLEQMRTEMSFDSMAPFLESSASFRARTVAALEELAARHSGQRLAIVTHGPVIMTFVAAVIGSQADFMLNPKLTSLTLVLTRDGRMTVDYVNARPHFECS